MEVHSAHPEDLDMPDPPHAAGFACPYLTALCRLDELGPEVIGQRLDPERGARSAGAAGT